MSNKRILLLKEVFEALDTIYDNLYEQIPLTYADKASKIIKAVFEETIRKCFKLF